MRPWIRSLGVGTALALALLSTRPAAAADSAPEDVAYRWILVPWRGLRGAEGTTRTKEEALAIAQAAQGEATKPGADVAVVAAARSEGLAKGGFVDFLRFTTDETFAQAVRALPVGGVSPPFETALGWNVAQRLPRDEAIAMLASVTGAFLGARFPYAGTLDAMNDRTKEQALADAKAAVGFLRNGARFEDLPGTLRAVPYSKRGWLAKTLRKGTALPDYRAIEDAVFSLALGGVSDPIESPIGWVVVRRVPWFRAHVKHLLVAHLQAIHIAPTVRRSKTQARERAEQALARLKVDPGAWGKLVAETSDDPSTVRTGGDRGVVEPGDLGNDLEQVLSGMKPGTIAGPIDTRLGYEILYRLD